MKYVHTNLISKDWKALAGFYIQVFDCKMILPQRDLSGNWLDKATNVKNAHIKGAHLRLPGYGKKGPTLEIFQYDEQEDQANPIPNRLGFGHIAFEVADVAAVLDQALKLGGQAFGTITSKEVESVGTLTFVYLKDPEGNIIELQNWDRVIETVADTDVATVEKPEKKTTATPQDTTVMDSKKNDDDSPLDKRSYLNKLYNDLDDAKRSVDDAKDEIKRTKAEAQKQTSNLKTSSLEDIVETKDTIKTKGQLLEELKQEMNLEEKKIVIGKTAPEPTPPKQETKTIALNPKDNPAKLKVEIKIDQTIQTLDLRSVKLSQKATDLAAKLRAFTTVHHSKEHKELLLVWIGKQYKADLVPLLKQAHPDHTQEQNNAAWALVPRFVGSLEHFLGKCQEETEILKQAGLQQLDLTAADFIAAYQDLQIIVLAAQAEKADHIRLYYSK